MDEMGILKGILIIMCVIAINIVVAYLTTQGASASGPTVAGCSTKNNFTTCQETDQNSFFSSVFETAVTGIDNAPGIFNVIYVVTLGIFLVAGIIEIVRNFIPTLPG